MWIGGAVAAAAALLTVRWSFRLGLEAACFPLCCQQGCAQGWVHRSNGAGRVDLCTIYLRFVASAVAAAVGAAAARCIMGGLQQQQRPRLPRDLMSSSRLLHGLPLQQRSVSQMASGDRGTPEGAARVAWPWPVPLAEPSLFLGGNSCMKSCTHVAADGHRRRPKG